MTDKILICPHTYKEVIVAQKTEGGLFEANGIVYDGKGRYLPKSRASRVADARDKADWFKRHAYKRRCKVR